MPSESKQLIQIEELIKGRDDDLAIGIKRILYPPRVCESCGHLDDVIGHDLCPCWSPATVEDIERMGLATRSEMVLSTITITRTLTDDEDPEFADIIAVDVEGDPSLVEQLGMLRMAEDTLLNGPGQAES